MKSRAFPIALLLTSLTGASFAADGANPPSMPVDPSPKTATVPAAATPAPGTVTPSVSAAAMPPSAPIAPTASTASPAPASPAQPATTTPAASTAATQPAASPSPAPKTPATAGTKPKPEAATMMPKVEVTKSRISEMDRALHEKDQEIDTETKKTKASDLDKTLNNPKASGFLSIFGGKSSKETEGLADQRVMLLEAERDLTEAIALAKTKEEKLDLQKQLEEFKAMRRDLDKENSAPR